MTQEFTFPCGPCGKCTQCAPIKWAIGVEHERLIGEKHDVIAMLNEAGFPRERPDPNEHGRMHPRTLKEQVSLVLEALKEAREELEVWRENCDNND
jgi:hypothetical protein